MYRSLPVIININSSEHIMIELFLLQSVASQNYYGANSFQLPNKTSVISQSDLFIL